MSRSSMNDTLIVVNFKTYQEAHGVAAEELAVIMQDLETNARMVAVVSAFDLSSVVSAAPNLEVWTQHLRSNKLWFKYWLVTPRYSGM